MYTPHFQASRCLTFQTNSNLLSRLLSASPAHFVSLLGRMLLRVLLPCEMQLKVLVMKLMMLQLQHRGHVVIGGAYTAGAAVGLCLVDSLHMKNAHAHTRTRRTRKPLILDPSTHEHMSCSFSPKFWSNNTYIYMYTYTHIHAYMHTCMHVCHYAVRSYFLTPTSTFI